MIHVYVHTVNDTCFFNDTCLYVYAINDTCLLMIHVYMFILLMIHVYVYTINDICLSMMHVYKWYMFMFILLMIHVYIFILLMIHDEDDVEHFRWRWRPGGVFLWWWTDDGFVVYEGQHLPPLHQRYMHLVKIYEKKLCSVNMGYTNNVTDWLMWSTYPKLTCLYHMTTVCE